VTFLRFCDVLGFAKKTKKNTNRVTKTKKCDIVTFGNCDIVTFGNVTKCHTFSNIGTKFRLPFMFGLGSERLYLAAAVKKILEKLVFGKDEIIAIGVLSCDGELGSWIFGCACARFRKPRAAGRRLQPQDLWAG